MTYNFDTIVDRSFTNSTKWTEYPEDVLPLWVADMDFFTPKPIQDALRSALEYGVLGYEKISRTLKESVVARMEKLYGWKIEPEMVMAVPGIVSGFNAAARAVCEPGEGVLIQPPVYSPFLKVHENLGLTRQFAPLLQVGDGNILRYEIDFETFGSTMGANDARTGMFLLCNPHNPTGNAFTQDELFKIAEICLCHGAVICSDEIHSELLLDGTCHTPIATLSPEIAKRTITLVAPSKTFNTAGLYCGFAIIPDPDLRERYKQAAEKLTFHVNSLGQIAAQAAFSGACDDWLGELLLYLSANRDFVVDYVRERMPEMRQTIPDATYLSWLDCNPLLKSGRINGNPYEFFLKEAKVALNNGAAFGPGGENFVRLNFACPRSTLKEALDRIREALSWELSRN